MRCKTHKVSMRLIIGQNLGWHCPKCKSGFLALSEDEQKIYDAGWAACELFLSSSLKRAERYESILSILKDDLEKW